MIHKTIRIFLAALVGVSIASCASKPGAEVRLSAVNIARWDTKVRFKDTAKNKTSNLNIDVLGERTGSLRLEATALMGYPVATYVMKSDGFKAAIYTQKVFYRGPVTEDALKPLLKIPLSPIVLRQIAFDEPLAGWSCVKNAAGEMSSCELSSAGVKAEWTRGENRRVVRLSGQGFEMDWVFGAPRTDVQLRDTSFELEPPQGYRIVRL